MGPSGAVDEPTLKDADPRWASTSRNLQSTWREAHGLAPGYGAPTYAPRVDQHGNEVDPIGSCLTQADGERGRNFLTTTMFNEAQRAVAAKEPGAVIREARLYQDLLSSQPLCFNLFGELSAPDRLDKATAVVWHLWPDFTGTVTEIRYEHNPHRGPHGLIGTKSAFDVFIDLQDSDGARSFIAIEVKYHENMHEEPLGLDAHDPEDQRARREALAEAASRVHGDLEDLRTSGVAQVWLDHALALSMIDPDVQAAHGVCHGQPCLPPYAQGMFVMLAPRGNGKVTAAYLAYRTYLERQGADLSTLGYVSVEDYLAACRASVPDCTWVEAVEGRYLAAVN